MNYKFLPSSIAFATAITFSLISCSDSEIQSSDIPELTQSIFIVPDLQINSMSTLMKKSAFAVFMQLMENIYRRNRLYLITVFTNGKLIMTKLVQLRSIPVLIKLESIT